MNKTSKINLSTALLVLMFIASPSSARNNNNVVVQKHKGPVVVKPGYKRPVVINKRPVVINKSPVVVYDNRGWSGYAAGAVITGIVIGAVIADANKVNPSDIQEIKGDDGITYYIVDGKKCILIDGKFKSVT